MGSPVQAGRPVPSEPVSAKRPDDDAEGTGPRAAAGTATEAGPPADIGAEPGPLRRDWRMVGLLIVAAWVLPVLTNLVRADALLIVLVVWGTGGLLRAGGTVLDRLMITVGLLIGTAITAGLLFSLWPFGLDPVAVGGTALTVLVLTGTALRRRPRWPHRVLGTDIALVGAFVVGTFVAYGPLRRGGTDLQLGYAGLTGDKLRDFNLFDGIHRIGGYPFLMQNQAKNVVDPGMLFAYPPGMHYLYALLDIFVTSRTDPGNPLSELMRYEYFTCFGYGFLVLSVAWGARWVAGPVMAGWRRTFLVGAITCFLSAGVITTAIWCGWDPQILGMGLLALLAAGMMRPPTRAREHILFAAAMCVAIALTYELFLPFAAVLVIASGVVYRNRWLPHWRMAAVVAVVAVPASLSEFAVAHTKGGLSATGQALAIGFTVPMTDQSLLIIAALAVAGFAVRRARRRPSAITGLLSVLVCGAAVVAYWAYQHEKIHTTTYYFEKTVQAWVVIALVSVGTFGHLLRLRAQGSTSRIPSRGLTGAVVGCVAIGLALVATDSYYYGKPSFEYSAKMKIGAHTTWERVWMSGLHIYPNNEKALAYLHAKGVLGDGVPTLVLWGSTDLDNVNMSLMLADFNHDEGQLTDQVNGLGITDELFSVGHYGAPWTKAQKQALASLEKTIAASPVPLRVIASNGAVAQKLEQWAAQNPQHHLTVIYLPDMPADSGP